MCAVVGIVANSPVNQGIYDALTVLQHRGQDAAGIMTCDEDDRVFLRKGKGLVRDVIEVSHMLGLRGTMGVGHVRYPTAGTSCASEAQPLYVNSPYGLAIVHNGNLVNEESLRKQLLEKGLRHLNTHSDSEILLNLFALELQKIATFKPTPKQLFQAVHAVHQQCAGGYATIFLLAGVGILAVRDPLGIRPLIYGKRANTQGVDYMVASESIALDTQGFEIIDDIQPGEAVFISKDGQVSRERCADSPGYSPCIFEYVYLSRPDSIVDKISVYQFRHSLGARLAQKIKQQDITDIDVVIPIPDTSRIAALALANELGIRYCEGFIKNRYIGRTFIMPGQQLRKKSVRQKLNPIGLEFSGKNVLLVDDSIVRGTTSKEIIQMARDAGAHKVYFASAAPPIRYPNVYGIDMPAASELVAHNRTVEEVAQEIGADVLIYQDLQALYDVAQECNKAITRFEDSVFSGDYLAGDINTAYLNELQQRRSEQARTNLLVENEVVEIYNTN